jgi:hypothetical protein
MAKPANDQLEQRNGVVVGLANEDTGHLRMLYPVQRDCAAGMV